jgi:hypothetical protein
VEEEPKIPLWFWVLVFVGLGLVVLAVDAVMNWLLPGR